MEQFSFVFTIFFMLIGPVKTIPAFGGLTREMDERFVREVAVRGVLIASAIVLFVALAGEELLGKYNISIDAVRIAGGLVLLISALNTIFKKSQPPAPGQGKPTALQLAVSPVAAPIIVPPQGIAAILIFILISPQYPGMVHAVFICLAIMMALNFVVMYFIGPIMRTSSLMMALMVLGGILVFFQACLAVQTMLFAFKSLGLVSV